jgi:hypothetical protein
MEERCIRVMGGGRQRTVGTELSQKGWFDDAHPRSRRPSGAETTWPLLGVTLTPRNCETNPSCGKGGIGWRPANYGRTGAGHGRELRGGCNKTNPNWGVMRPEWGRNGRERSHSTVKRGCASDCRHGTTGRRLVRLGCARYTGGQSAGGFVRCDSKGCAAREIVKLSQCSTRGEVYKSGDCL